MAANKIDLVKPLVPRPPDTFTGRDAEIALLRRFMSRQRLVVIKGIGGIGKTALALAHLDEIRRAHPQRDIRFIRCSEHEGVAALFGETQSADAPMAFIHEINAADAVLLLDDVHLLPADQAGLLVRLLQTYLTGHIHRAGHQQAGDEAQQQGVPAHRPHQRSCVVFRQGRRGGVQGQQIGQQGRASVGTEPFELDLGQIDPIDGGQGEILSLIHI